MIQIQTKQLLIAGVCILSCGLDGYVREPKKRQIKIVGHVEYLLQIFTRHFMKRNASILVTLFFPIETN